MILYFQSEIYVRITFCQQKLPSEIYCCCLTIVPVHWFILSILKNLRTVQHFGVSSLFLLLLPIGHFLLIQLMSGNQRDSEQQLPSASFAVSWPTSGQEAHQCDDSKGLNFAIMLLISPNFQELSRFSYFLLLILKDHFESLFT